MELCDSNLSKILINKLINDKKGFNPKELFGIMKQLNKAFKIMNENNIIHGNLKLENILIKYSDNQYKNYTIKLSDYGCRKGLLSLFNNNIYTNIGTIAYMAPEILKGEEYNYKCDLWSIGIIIYRLIFGKLPFIGKDNLLLNNFEKITNDLLEKTGNEDLDDLIQKLLEKEPEKRLNWNEYFAHSFFIEKYRNRINLIYSRGSYENIFGIKFVENNKNNIELKINGIPNKLVSKFKLEENQNNIEIIIKNTINNFEDMFYNCDKLINIEELKYLDISEVNSLSYMFCGCSSLSDIKALEKWDVSKIANFSFMFDECKLLSNIKPLEKWNVSNGTNFNAIFACCSSLSDIKPLEKWNVSKGKNFRSVFNKCKLLSDIKPLGKWDVSNGLYFSDMFGDCNLLSDITPLEKWNVSEGIEFQSMFSLCSSLSNIKPLEKWDVSNGKYFYHMFSQCSSLDEIKPLEKWNVSNGIDFSFMFAWCPFITDKRIKEKWDIPNEAKILNMFLN